MGDVMPGAKAAPAARDATRTELSEGRDSVKPTPSLMCARGSEAATSRARQARRTAAATGGRVRWSTMDPMTPRPPGCPSRVWARTAVATRWAVAMRETGPMTSRPVSSPPRGGREGRKTRWPSTESRAGTSVTETATPTRTDRAIGGPKLRKKSDRAASRAAVPAATVIPAAMMIGVKDPTACATASSQSSPLRRRSASAAT